MSTTLKRVHSIAPGEYSASHGRVILSCPCCSRIDTIDYPYRVGTEGTVWPEWRCPCCGWQDQLRLGDFGEAVVP